MAGQYPIKLELELSNWESLSQLVEFFRYVRRSAGGGHSFMIAADESAEGPGLKEFGKQMAGAVCFIDGDGNDHIGRIFLNGQDVTEVRSDRSVKIADALSQMKNLRHRMDSMDR